MLGRVGSQTVTTGGMGRPLAVSRLVVSPGSAHTALIGQVALRDFIITPILRGETPVSFFGAIAKACLRNETLACRIERLNFVLVEGLAIARPITFSFMEGLPKGASTSRNSAFVSFFQQQQSCAFGVGREHIVGLWLPGVRIAQQSTCRQYSSINPISVKSRRQCTQQTSPR